MKITIFRFACVLLSIVAIAFAQTARDIQAKYEADLKANPRSSVTRFRLGEIYFEQLNFQLAANTFRQALNGDLQPKWVEVWSHIKLGNIFDATDQRQRAINEYMQAQWTKDNTRGAQEEVAMYLEFPFPRL
jgi:tetratricopeptide (TPR) repeat protein